MTHLLTIEIPENIYRGIMNEAESKKLNIEEIALERLAKDEFSGDEEFERLADELADFVEKNMPSDAQPLSDYAMSRDEIYEDRL